MFTRSLSWAGAMELPTFGAHSDTPSTPSHLQRVKQLVSRQAEQAQALHVDRCRKRQVVHMHIRRRRRSAPAAAAADALTALIWLHLGGYKQWYTRV